MNNLQNAWSFWPAKINISTYSATALQNINATQKTPSLLNFKPRYEKTETKQNQRAMWKNISQTVYKLKKIDVN